MLSAKFWRAFSNNWSNRSMFLSQILWVFQEIWRCRRDGSQANWNDHYWCLITPNDFWTGFCGIIDEFQCFFTDFLRNFYGNNFSTSICLRFSLYFKIDEKLNYFFWHRNNPINSYLTVWKFKDFFLPLRSKIAILTVFRLWIWIFMKSSNLEMSMIANNSKFIPAKMVKTALIWVFKMT